MSEPTSPQAAKSMRSKRIVFMLVLSAVLVALELMWFLEAQDEKKGLRELPDPERAALYARTRETLERICDLQTRPKGLRSFCHDQAELIVHLPECDGMCQALAKRARKAGR